MDDELVLLTSYFNLVEGRRQDAADSFRVEPDVPSNTSPDNHAALYVITEASSSQTGQRARRLTADTVAWEFSSHADEAPAARLKQALRAARDAVQAEFEGHVSVGASAIAVEGSSIFLGQISPAQVYVLHDERLHSIEAEAPSSRRSRPKPPAKISVYADQIEPGDVVALTSSWFSSGVTSAELRDAFGAGGAEEISTALLEQAEDKSADAMAVVIEAVRASELERQTGAVAIGPGVSDQVSGAVQALTSVGRMLWTELTAVPAANGRRPRKSPSARRARAEGRAGVEARRTPEEGSSLHEQFTEEVPAVPYSGAAGVALEPVPETEDLDLDGTASSAEAVPRAEIAAEPEAEPISELDLLNSRLQIDEQHQEEAIPPVQAFPDASATEPERIYASSKEIDAVNKRPRRFGGINRTARDFAGDAAVLRPSLKGVDFGRPSGRGAPPAIVWSGIAVLGILIVVAGFFYVHNQQKTAVDPYPAKVSQDIRLAKAAKHPVQQDYYLARAHHNLKLATRHGAKPGQLQRLQAALLTVGDRLHHVSRVTSPTVLANFKQYKGSQPSRIVTGPGLIFVLDQGRKSVYSVSSNASHGPTAVVSAGDVVDGFVVHNPVQIAADGTEALILDSTNTLIRDAAGTETATSLASAEPNQSIAAMAVFDPDVYLVDTKNSQLWRYADAVAGYNPTAQAYFTSDIPDLSHASSLAFDTSSTYVLLSSGKVLKYGYLLANTEPFTLNLRTPLGSSASLFTSPGLHYVWIADPAHSRIVQLTPSGRYVRTYLSGTTSMQLGHVSSFSVGPNGNTMYVLTGGRLFDFSVAH
ncbi:MAG: hypothetical protein ACRDFS_07830 [Chloroflexota bacterium]